MATLTRQQIIDLINQYIYTNGNQRITAAQMNEILLAIAKAFAMDGSAAGIDAVLAVGSNVIAGRKIKNGDGGSVNLAATHTVEDQVYKYLGFDVAAPTLEGATYTGLGRSIVGNIKRSGPTRNFLNMIPLKSLDAGEMLSATFYQAIGTTKDSEGPTDGVHHLATHEYGRSQLGVCKEFIYMGVKKEQDEDLFSNTNYDSGNISSEVVKGPQSSIHSQKSDNIQMTVKNGLTEFSKAMNLGTETWVGTEGPAFIVNNKGVKLPVGKKLALTTGGGTIATAGLATLSGGSVTISTNAVQANSIISLTVQETGAFTGNIRVSAKVAGTSFTITSSQDTDNCSVFWQIIDL